MTGVDARGSSYDLELSTSGKMKIATFASAPTSSSAAGASGTIIFTADYIYVYTGTAWKRTALTTW